MARGVILALSNAVSDDVDHEFNQWYDDVHAREVLAIPGVRSFRRFRLAPAQVLATEEVLARRYLAIYEVDTDDWDGVVSEFHGRFGDGRITIRPELIELDPMVLTSAFEEITSEVTS
jgi:hypothetical protein